VKVFSSHCYHVFGYFFCLNGNTGAKIHKKGKSAKLLAKYFVGKQKAETTVMIVTLV